MSEAAKGTRQRKAYVVREGGSHVVESGAPKAGRKPGPDDAQVKVAPVEGVKVKEGE